MKEKLLKYIEDNGLMITLANMGGYKMFDKIFPNYFFPEGRINRDRIIEFLNECVEINEKREGESIIYLYDYNSDILYQEWDDEGDDESEYYQYESRIISFGTDIAYVEVWQYDDEGNMFDDAYDYVDIPLNRLDSKFLIKIFEQLWGNFKL